MFSGACNCLSTREQTADCSILKGTQPTLFSLRDGNLCELSDTNSCTEVFVTGQHFLESNTDRTLSCHFEVGTFAILKGAVVAMIVW